MAAMPPPPPPPPGNHGAGPSHYNDENAGVDLSESSGRDLEHVFNNLTHHVNAGREEVARYIAAVRMERENELFDQNIRRHVQADRQRRAAEQQRRAAEQQRRAAEDQQRRAEFQHNNSIEPYVPQPLPGFVNPLAEFGIPLRTQANTQFNTNGVNPR
jgi:hypothetical protein